MILENGEKAKKKKKPSARYRCCIGIIIIILCRGIDEVNVMTWLRVKTKCGLL
jgi:hypothetical protein